MIFHDCFKNQFGAGASLFIIMQYSIQQYTTTIQLLSFMGFLNWGVGS